MTDPSAARHRYREPISTDVSISSDSALFAALLEAAPDATVVTDAAGRIVVVNGQAEAMFGYSRLELIGKPVEALMPEALRPLHRGHRTRYTDDPHARPMGRNLDLVARRKDGTDFPCEISLAPLHTPDGLLITSAIRDITDRRRAENERLQLELEHEARLRAEDAVRVREEFLSTAAHELKTPLTSVKVAAQFLDRLLAQEDADGEQLRKLSGQLNSQVTRLETLVTDLLDISRVQLGRLALRARPADLVTIVRGVVERFEHAPERTERHTLVLDAPDELEGFWDPERLDQVLTNLLSNALKYSPDGGEVRVRLERDADSAFIEVEDHGVGIPAHEITQLFQPFSRASVSREISGTGLGLYISRGIVERHGGTLDARSEPGAATTFRVTLPLANEPR